MLHKQSVSERTRLLLLCGLIFAAMGPSSPLTASLARADMPPPPANPALRADAERLRNLIATDGEFEVTSANDDGYVLTLKNGGTPEGNIVIGLGRPGADKPRVRTAHYTLAVNMLGPRADVIEALVHAADRIAASDGGPLPEAPVELLQQPHKELAGAAIIASFIALGLGLWRRKVLVNVRLPFIIQGFVQGSVFVYWSFYWPGVRNQLPQMLLMLVLAYALDAAFAFARFGSWRLGLAPLPVVLSINLFVWLDWKGAVLALVAAFAAKTLIQRDGRHIFNPSVAGLAVTAICTIVFPGFVHFGGLFHTLNIAPNMAEWIFLVSLIPLIKFRLAPVSIGSILGLYYLTQAPGAVRPTLLLMMTLLATDPATTPRSDLGRLLFGLVVGSTYIFFRALLAHLGQPDDFAKILSVPIPNLLVPQFDLVSTWITMRLKEGWERFRVGAAPSLVAPLERLGQRLTPMPRPISIGVWALLFGFALHDEKPKDYEAALHWTWGTPHVMRDADGVPRCENNPIFCKPFAFTPEVTAWAAGGATPTVARTQ